MEEPATVEEILVLDDDTLVLRALEATLKRHYRVHCAASGERGIEVLAQNPNIAAAIIDQRMPGMNGPEFIRRTAEPYPNLVRIILTGYQDIESLKQAINNGGAYRYLEKPCPNEELLRAVEGAVELHRRLLENAALPEVLERANDDLRRKNERLARENFQLRLDAERDFPVAGSIVGSAPVIQKVLVDAERVASTESTVLILGETGTGKDLLARHLHERGPRRARTFRAHNCGAVAEHLMEDVLFGHVAGAFTGAQGLKRGLFEIANGGTLFLDEIGECAPSLQARLLRVVEDQVVYRLGDEENPISVDVRLIAATNRDLEQEVQAGRFRQDLFYRLNVLCLVMPPLRERGGDVRELVSHFIAHFNQRARNASGKFITGITPEALDLLERYDFPGNVRELSNIIERAWLYADDECPIALEHVAPHLRAPRAARAGAKDAADAGALSLKQAVIAFKSEFLAKELARNDWNVSATARALGITRTTLYEEIKDCGLQRPPDASGS